MELAQWQQQTNQQIQRASQRVGELLRDLKDAEKTLVALLSRVEAVAADLASEKQSAKDEREGMNVRLRAVEQPRPRPEREPDERVVAVSS